MIGALTLLFILAITLMIVRVAGVALRLTGLPQPVARFQSISALTGTGFTTSEAEGTMHHPVRRRILTLLMFAGHLGVVTLASTVILTMTATESGPSMVLQILAMLLAIAVIGILAASKTLDVVMCDWVGRLLTRIGWIETQSYELMYEAPNGMQLCEHIVGPRSQIDLDLMVVSVNGKPVANGESAKLSLGDRVVVYARATDQEKWANDEKSEAGKVS